MFRTVESILRAVFMKPDSFQSLQLELDSKKKELSKVYGRIEKHVEKVVSNFDYLRNLFNLLSTNLTAFPFPEIHRGQKQTTEGAAQEIQRPKPVD